MAEGNDVSELKLSRDGISLKSATLNTLLTLIAALAGVGSLVLLLQHQQDMREANLAFVSAVKDQTAAIKEQTKVAREANCLIIVKDPEQCRRIAQ